jgi:hypothetical protein
MKPIYEPAGRAKEYCDLNCFFGIKIMSGNKPSYSSRTVVFFKYCSTAASTCYSFFRIVTEVSFSIMTRNVFSRPVFRTIFKKLSSASASALNYWVKFSWFPTILPCSMLKFVLGYISSKCKIFWAIIRLIFINMMDYFSFTKKTTDDFFHNQPMLINISSNIGVKVIRHFNSNVSVRRSYFAALLVWVFT